MVKEDDWKITKEFKNGLVIYSVNGKEFAWYTIEWYNEQQEAYKEWNRELKEMGGLIWKTN